MHREREFCIDNLLVRIHLIIEMIRWTGLAPWEFEFPSDACRYLEQLALDLARRREKAAEKLRGEEPGAAISLPTSGLPPFGCLGLPIA